MAQAALLPQRKITPTGAVSVTKRPLTEIILFAVCELDTLQAWWYKKTSGGDWERIE
jgi:hypothetical protein